MLVAYASSETSPFSPSPRADGGAISNPFESQNFFNQASKEASTSKWAQYVIPNHNKASLAVRQTPSDEVNSSVNNPRAIGSKTYKQQRIINAPDNNAGASWPNSLLKSLNREDNSPKPITVRATSEKSRLKKVETPVERSSLLVSTVNHQNTCLLYTSPSPRD